MTHVHDPRDETSPSSSSTSGKNAPRQAKNDAAPPTEESGAIESGQADGPSRKAPTRRQILIGAGVGVGLLVGYALWPRHYPLNVPVQPGEQLLNAWVKIGNDGQITVVTPQAEMGQGVFTALPQILADELGADWHTVGVMPAPLHPAYANLTLAHMAVPPGVPGALRDILHWGAAELVRRFDIQLTGGSSSVRAFYGALRLAGASARELLCKAAARRWGVDWRDCDTRDGFVIHAGTRLPFAELAALAGREELSPEPTLRTQPTLIGQPVPRLDTPSKTDGSARYGIDVRLPDMYYAAVRAGPVDGAPLLRVNDRDLKLLGPGISLVQGPNWVATVARTWWTARRALDTVKASWSRVERPAGPWMEDALAKALTSDAGTAFRDDGDVARALRVAEPIEAVYSVPPLAHACLEPMTATVRITGRKVEVWAPTQSTTFTRWAVARALDVPSEDVTVFPTLLGGGFGRKSEVDAAVQAALIAREVGRPVQLIWSREEDTGQDKYRPPAMARMRAVLGPDRSILGLEARVAVPNVAASFSERTLPAMMAEPLDKATAAALTGLVDTPYAIANLRVSHVPVVLPVPFGFWRSVEHSYTAFFMESFVDELAQASGMTPLDFRLQLLKDKPRHRSVLHAAAARVGKDRRSPDARRRYGVGFALHESFGSIVAQAVELSLGEHDDLRIDRVSCAIDCGLTINPDIVVQQMEGSIIFGLSAVLNQAISFKDGYAEQANFDRFPLLNLAQTPVIDVFITPSSAPPTGVGEPGVPPIAPAVVNAIFNATGQRVRDLPLSRSKVIL